MPWIIMVALSVSCAFQSTSFGIIKNVNAWLYTEESFMSSFEKISALTLVSLGLVLYVAICVILIKVLSAFV
ncbi:hypothetical protein L596_026751 [Steinernema carpocapsae]|uniref:Uncharacterized protein n=1 Tax=Steinernema carpocapsae TaxID=34508 RepID=A0A4U5M2F3_STECR|nr:hypothetical protein L596_026751 [Steinernema carpocapsae]